MTPSRVALVGHCGPDSSYLRLAVSTAVRGAKVLTADDEKELQRLLAEGVDLLLVNRVLDYGFDQTEGVDLIRRLRGDHPDLKTMLISDFPDAQAGATQAGALPGFGKREVNSPRAQKLLRDALQVETPPTA
jgi:CheY-like chemotaxis protein